MTNSTESGQAAPGLPVVATEREKFDAYWMLPYKEQPITNWQIAWEAWQARAAQASDAQALNAELKEALRELRMHFPSISAMKAADYTDAEIMAANDAYDAARAALCKEKK